MMHTLTSLDLRLLQIFDALLRHRSVSRSAEALDLPQPTVSQGLRRLRTLFDDPLFVRTAAGMTPTGCAKHLSEPIAAIVAIARDQILPAPRFDPLQSKREFGIITTDFGALTILPILLPRLRSSAPNVRLRVLPMDFAVFDRLASMQADLALGILSATPLPIRTRIVFRDTYACVLRVDHPALRSTAAQSALRDAEHVVVSSRIDGTGAADESAFKGLRSGGIVLRVPGYAALPSILRTTDLIAIVPRTAGRPFFSGLDFRFVDPPVTMPEITVVEAWHERNEDDLGLRWLRDVVADVFNVFGQ